MDWKDRRLINNETVALKINGEETDEAKLGRAVRQGCLISPLLFSVYTQAIMNEALATMMHGITIGGHLIDEVRYADDQAILADSEKGLQRLMDSLHQDKDNESIKNRK